MSPEDARFRLPESDVHLWIARSDDVRDPATLARYSAMMSADEHVRHDRFVFDKDRHQFLVTRGMIRTLIGRYLDVDPAGCAFEADPYGRPALVHPPGAGLAFNISHTTGLVACVFARDAEIGVDVEDASRPVEPGLARRFFSPDEADALEGVAEQARPARFYEYWTLKEAYVKARGMGLSLPLDGFSMRLDTRPVGIRFTDAIDDDPRTWQFAQFTPGPRYQLAVALRRHGPDRSILVRDFDSGALSRPSVRV
jgi:4'-phosphopantetheinyl transferase